MATTFYEQMTMATEVCCNCGILFAMPHEIKERKRTEGGSFYCPNGHGQHYSKSEVQRLRDELIREKSAREQAQALANDLENDKRNLSCKLDRINKRIKNGVCPCCKRHFNNLQNHMETMHKEGAAGNQGSAPNSTQQPRYVRPKRAHAKRTS
jgi:hypothetical protein